jgi:tetratricopeptide (TPR) repeat protein
MRRTGYLGISLLLVFALAAASLPVFGQAAPAAQAKGPQAKTQAEYTAYKALYDEQNPQKKAELGEKFLTDFKESDFIANTYTMIIGAYTRAQNWSKVIDAAERAVASPVADNKLKGFAYLNAMAASQNLNQVDKILSYGDKVLAVDPNNLNAMFTLATVIPARLPADDAAKKAALTKAEDLAKKALAGLEPLLAQAPAGQKAEITQIQSQLHATLGLIAYDRMDTMKSIEEYEATLKISPKDDFAHFYLGANYQILTGQASRQYQEALKAENDAKAAKADQPTIDELAAKRQGLENEVREKRDKAIDEYAIAVAIGGGSAPNARAELQKLWQGKNDNLNGMDEFIAQKKSQLGQ